MVAKAYSINCEMVDAVSGVRVFPHIKNAIDIANHKMVYSYSYETPCLAMEGLSKELELCARWGNYGVIE